MLTQKQHIMKPNQIKYIIYPLLILAAWLWMSIYTFNEKPDLNGDNFYYYIYATSLAEGNGYCDLSAPGAPPTASWPPGYAIMMTPLRWITDSVVAQKWLSEIFVLLSLILLYFTLIRLGAPMSLAFIGAFAGAFIPRVLHFSTMMMSETAFMFTSLCVIYCLARMTESEDHWLAELKRPWLYFMIAALVLNYHVRTQGLALIGAVVLALLIRKRWGALLTTICGVIVGSLPWMIRNHILGLNGNRYVDQMMMANAFRPEEGTIGLGEFVSRFFDHVRMLLFNAIPNSVTPFFNLNPDAPEYAFWIYLVGAVMVTLMLYGCWQMGKLRWVMIGYFAASVALIASFSSPSGNRYLTGLLPLLTMTLLVGIWAALTQLIRLKWQDKSFPALILGLLILFAIPGLKAEHQMSQQKYPLQYRHFFQAAKDLKKIAPKGAVVASRKPQMFWLYSNLPGVVYKYSLDPQEVLQDLIAKKVDYVILDALGYSSTYRYLLPAIQRYPQYFPIIKHYEATHTYLLQFTGATPVSVGAAACRDGSVGRRCEAECRKSKVESRKQEVR